MRLFNIQFFLIAVLNLAAFNAFSQSTIGDPFPMYGGVHDAARAATHYAMLGPDGKPLSPQEKAKRQAHRTQHRACQRSAERMPIATRARNNAKYRCDNTYIQQQATWLGVTPVMVGAQQRRADHSNCRSQALEVDAGPARQRIRAMCDQKYPKG